MTTISSCKLSRKCRIVYQQRATSSSPLKAIKMSIPEMTCSILSITSTSTPWLISPSSAKSKGKVQLILKQMFILNQDKTRVISTRKPSRFQKEEMASLVQLKQFKCYSQLKSLIAKLNLYMSHQNLVIHLKLT